MAGKAKKWDRFREIIERRWQEVLAFLFFVGLVAFGIVAPAVTSADRAERFGPAFNVALSIGTSGIVAFVFYYIVNERLERRRGELVRRGALRAYQGAKRNIALAVIHASQKGGRHDLHADTDTIDAVLTIEGFKRMFKHGSQADEGFYAFQNQMSDQTPEYHEIIFNLRSMGRAFDRLIDNRQIDDAAMYDRFVQLGAAVRRIEHNGAGYDESKFLCRFIWEIFAGWNWEDGDLDQDPIEKAIQNA